jgi:autotransporter strand-loop-strand O-heptosyltransferase
MKIINVTPGLLPIPPNGWGAVEKIIWETHNALLELGHDSQIQYLNEVKDYDVVHIHVANLANMAYERGIPYYFTMHDHHAYLYGKDSQVYKENLQAIKNAKKAFVPAKFLVDYFEGIPEYFSHGVNTNYFTPGDYKEHKLLCVANNGFIHNQAEDRKGFGYAIEAAKQLNLPITIAGPNNNKNYFETFPPDYDKLTILYDLNEEQLRDLYKEHSIFIHASILEAGHPNLTLLEALASGLPIISTFEDNNSLEGLLKVDRDVDQIKQKIKYLVSNPIKYLKYSKKAKQQAIDLSWKNRVKDLLEKYEINMKDQLISIYKTERLNKSSKPHLPRFNVNFINGPFVEILNSPYENHIVKFINKKTGGIEYSQKIGNNCWVRASKQYFIDWKIKVEDEKGNVIFDYDFNAENKRVYVALDSKSLGDTLAWFPYVDEFRKKHNCKVICSTFHNNLFQDQYPEIEFINPGEVAHNLYAMYTIGWFYFADGKMDLNKNVSDFRCIPLQQTSSDILGLEFKEVIPKLKKSLVAKKKQISIAIHGTAQAKYWNNSNGWQEVVDWCNNNGYEVILLSKEEDGYMGNKHPIGIKYPASFNFNDTIKTLHESELFIGISSGLSWLSWATNTPTVVISGFTEPYTEPESCYHFDAPQGKCRGCFNSHQLDAGDWNWCPVHKGTDRQFECSKSITSEMVIEKLKEILVVS